MAIYELWMSRNNGVDATNYVGTAGKLWYDPDTQSIRSSDGTTPGGSSINGGGGSTYTNTNVVNLLAAFGSNSISTTGNVTATRFIGSGANLTALTGANVTGQVPFAAVANSVTLANVTGIGNIASLNITANAAQVLYGNGVFAASYANSNVNSHLAAFGSNNIVTTGNVTANYLIGNHLGDQQVQVTNRTGASIPAGSVVRIVGYQGGNMTIALASSTGEADSASTLGIVVADIANNGVGFVQYNGTIYNQNTSAFSEGDLLYLSTTPGQLTTTAPAAPAHTVRIGWVRSVNANTGSIYIKVDNGYELDELHNVLISGTVANNSVLQYNSATGIWRNVTQPTFGMTTIDGDLQTYGPITTSEIRNGASNVRIASSGNIGFSINNVSNAVSIVGNGISTTGNVDAGAIRTDNLLYANGVARPTGGGATVAGANTQIQFNSAGSLGASPNLVFNTATNNLTVTGSILASGQLRVANIISNTTINATGNINSANLTTGNITVSGEINITSGATAGSFTTPGTINATGQITTDANVITGTEAATSLSTGSLRSRGGAAITGNLYVGGVINSSSVIILTPSSSVPTATSGAFAVAQPPGWDPATKGGTASYPVFYNGTTWIALY